MLVAQTEDGRADSVKGDCFVKPLEEKMRFCDFLDILEGKKDSKARIYYIQHQNGSFQKEYHELSADVNIDDLNFATEAFGLPPDAINFWCGTSQSVTSLHKDPYENIYCVIKGYKTFTLLPPTDLPFLYQKNYKSATLQESENNDLVISIDDPKSTIPWLSVDPDNLNLDTYPHSKHIHPVRVRVGPGEILYLPSLWFHKVGQIGDEEGRNISINLWYDMKYSFNYVYYRLLEDLVVSTSKQIDKKGENRDDESKETNDDSNQSDSDKESEDQGNKGENSDAII